MCPGCTCRHVQTCMWHAGATCRCGSCSLVLLTLSPGRVRNPNPPSLDAAAGIQTFQQGVVGLWPFDTLTLTDAATGSSGVPTQRAVSPALIGSDATIIGDSPLPTAAVQVRY